MWQISAGYWLERAGVVSDIARVMNDPATRRTMLEAASNYRWLADHTAKQTDNGPAAPSATGSA